MRNKLAKKCESLRRQFAGKNGYPRGISTRSVETRNEAKPNGIITDQKDDRNCTGRRPSRGHRRAIRENRSYPSACQVGRKCRQAVVLIIRPAIIDRNVVTLSIADLFQALLESGCH